MSMFPGTPAACKIVGLHSNSLSPRPMMGSVSVSLHNVSVYYRFPKPLNRWASRYQGPSRDTLRNLP